MSLSDVRNILKRIEEQLAKVADLDPQAESAIEDLLNLVEHLVIDQEALAQEVRRLKQQLDSKKKAKTTNTGDDKPNTDHSLKNIAANAKAPSRRLAVIADRSRN